MKVNKGSGRGQGFIEVVSVALVLIPLALALLDLIVVVIANSMNDTAAKNCARAAANQGDQNSANQAAAKALATFNSSAIVHSINQQCTWTTDTATVKTTMVVNLPVPFPGFGQLTFVAQDVEPVVSN